MMAEPDIARIKRNIGRMIEQGAPETDIDAYIAGEGVSAAQLRGEAEFATRGPDVSTAEDMARSAATGVRTGLETAAGTFGDARELGVSGVDFLMEKIGASDEQRQIAKQVAGLFTPFPSAPTTDQIEGATDSVIGDRYEPQTTAGEYARTGGEFISGAAAPGGVVRKAAMVAAPAIASETAGQLTEGTEIEPYARFTAALLGGAAAAKGRARDALKEIPDPPSLEQVRQDVSKLYDGLRDAGITYDPVGFGNFVKSIAQQAKKDKAHRVAKKTFGLVEELGEMVDGVVDFGDLDSVRKAAGNIARNDIDKTERMFARKIVDGINQFESRAQIATNGAIDPADFNKVRKEARELASRKIKAEVIAETIEAGTNARSGADNGLRNAFIALAKPKRLRKYNFTAEEKKAINDVANGNVTRNAMHAFGKLGIDPTRFGSAAALIPSLGFGGAAAAAGPIEGGLLVGLGTISKFAARKGTQDAAKDVLTTTMRGREGQKAAAQARKTDQIRAQVRSLIAGEAASRPIRSPAVESLGNNDR